VEGLFTIAYSFDMNDGMPSRSRALVMEESVVVLEEETLLLEEEGEDGGELRHD
jgi:hypothetical protein